MKKLVLILIAVLMMLHLSFAGTNEKKPKHIKSKYKIELGLKPRGQKYWC